jgi:Peptidase family C25/Propeptide_C25
MEFLFNEASYAKNEFRNLELATVETIGIMRGVQMGKLAINPIQYNPVENTLKIYNNLEVEVKFINADHAKTIELKQKYFSPAFTMSYKNLINYRPLSNRDTITGYPIKTYLQGFYTADTPSDPAPTYLLFVGDVAEIPTFSNIASASQPHKTDLYYCEYTSDYLPEVYYGRFSASNVADLEPQIDKTL